MTVFFLLAKPVVMMFFKGDPEAVPLTVTGFRMFVLAMVFFSLNTVYRSFCQASGQPKKAWFISLADNLAAPLLAAWVSGLLFGVLAVWLCYVIGEGLAALAMICAFRRGNQDKKGFASTLPFPASFAGDITASFECSIGTEKELVAMSEYANDCCLKAGADRRTAFLIALSIEEMAGNVIEHGFTDGKAHRVDLRILKKTGRWIVRIRDDAGHFNPVDYIEQYAGEDPVENIGLKMIRGLADEMIYLSALNLNNLIIKI